MHALNYVSKLNNNQIQQHTTVLINRCYKDEVELSFYMVCREWRFIPLHKNLSINSEEGKPAVTVQWTKHKTYHSRGKYRSCL